MIFKPYNTVDIISIAILVWIRNFRAQTLAKPNIYVKQSFLRYCFTVNAHWQLCDTEKFDLILII